MPAPSRPGGARRAAPPLVAIIGPTAVGKSELAVAVAERIGGEIVSADSRQVYRGMDIGTAKLSPAARRGVPHHLIDVVEPDEPFSLADWLRLAHGAIEEIARRGRMPMVVGGTGLYVSALVDGYRLDGPPPPELRTALVRELDASGLAALAARLEALSPPLAAATDLRNPRRVVRALERLASGGGGVEPPRTRPYPGRVATVALSRPAATLRERIALRARRHFEAGLLDETRRLLDAGYGPELRSMSGIGYREAIRHLAGEWSLDEAVTATERRTRTYAKRQMTWFRGHGDALWVALGDRSADDPGAVDEVAGLIYRCLA